MYIFIRLARAEQRKVSRFTIALGKADVSFSLRDRPGDSFWKFRMGKVSAGFVVITETEGPKDHAREGGSGWNQLTHCVCI